MPSALRRKALTRYQMLFRHMFYCKHVERQLCGVWVSSKAAKQHALHSAKWCVLRHTGRVPGCTPGGGRLLPSSSSAGSVPLPPARARGLAASPGGTP